MGELELNFPAEVTALVRHKQEGNQNLLWDPCRKKWLVATPEEWVRQHAISYLYLLGYSFALIETESGLRTGFKEKRSDALVYKHSAPFILVECKAPTVKIDQKVFNQAFNYNQRLQAKHLYLTNGKQHIFWDVTGNKALESLPSASDPNS
jgi:hypothetical protein